MPLSRFFWQMSPLPDPHRVSTPPEAPALWSPAHTRHRHCLSISTKVHRYRKGNDCLPASTAPLLQVRERDREREGGREGGNEYENNVSAFTQSPTRSRLRPLFLLKKSFVESWQSCRTKPLSENKEECVCARACHCARACVCVCACEPECVHIWEQDSMC